MMFDDRTTWPEDWLADFLACLAAGEAAYAREARVPEYSTGSHLIIETPS
jgi:hypothetical protein